MSWAAVAGAAVGVVGGALSANSASRAQRGAADSATNAQLAMFDQNRADQAPWREAGARGVGRLEYLLGLGGGEGNNDPAYGSLMRDFSMEDFQADPGYAFRQREGEAAINRNALAKGRYNSGSVLKALQGYNSDLASQEFGNAYNRFQSNRATRYGQLAGISGVGQTATNQVNQDRTNLGNSIAGNINAAGNASAARSIGIGNAINTGIGQGVNIWQSNQMLNALRRPQSGSAPISSYGNDGINLGSGRE